MHRPGRCVSSPSLEVPVAQLGFFYQRQRKSHRRRLTQNRRKRFHLICVPRHDDLNTDIGHLDGHPQARTPNIDRLARSGVSFRRAYSNNPICAPSRSSFLTGIYPHTSENLFWNKWFENEILANSKTIYGVFPRQRLRSGRVG